MKEYPKIHPRFSEAVRFVESLEGRGWRLGLDRMMAFAEACGVSDSLGIGESSPKFIHVAGTNGKGSVTAMVQSILTQAGFRTGGFFSPYVVTILERIQLNNRNIGQTDFVEAVEALSPIVRQFDDHEMGAVTEFEFKTAMGLHVWKKNNCDWVALEVGLGGRLDATNIVTPRASVITSIGLDHMALLGDNVKAIAAEKGGIIKPGIPTVIGNCPDGSDEVLRHIAREQNSELWQLGQDIHFQAGETLKIQTPGRSYELRYGELKGGVQNQNTAVAVVALEQAGLNLPDETISEGLANVSIPGRFQQFPWRGRTMIMDGAHNVDSARALRERLELLNPNRVVLLTSMLQGHDPDDFYAELAGQFDVAIATVIDFHRAMPLDVISGSLRKFCPQVEEMPSQKDAYVRAFSQAKEGDVILVTGSFYLVGAIMRMYYKELEATVQSPHEADHESPDEPVQ